MEYSLLNLKHDTRLTLLWEYKTNVCFKLCFLQNRLVYIKNPDLKQIVIFNIKS